jgi:hypothetical protein
MNKNSSRFYGALLCGGISLVIIVFLIGIFQKNYWALAIPVMLGFLSVMSLGFWVGWTILTIKIDVPTAEETQETKNNN